MLFSFMLPVCATFQGKTLVEQEKLMCGMEVVGFAHACMPQANDKKERMLE
jgi:hypothetical protein